MKKISFMKCNKYRNFKNPKTSYIFNEALVLSIINNKCGSNMNTIYEYNLVLIDNINE